VSSQLDSIDNIFTIFSFTICSFIWLFSHFFQKNVQIYDKYLEIPKKSCKFVGFLY